MKLLDFETDNKKYCLVKLDNHNFSVREYLQVPKEINYKDKISITEFKAPSQYFGTLEYALRKAFSLLRKDYIPKEKFSLFYPTYDPSKSIFELKAYEVNANNLDEIRELIEKAISFNELEETLVS